MDNKMVPNKLLQAKCEDARLSNGVRDALLVMDSPRTSGVRWLDFSGAPPMLIPLSLAALWRGTTDRATGEYREHSVEAPVTDYDRACAVAWPGRSILEFMGSSLLVLYMESDLNTWDDQRELVACGGWLPSDDELKSATWTDRIHWHQQETDFLLMNSAADGGQGLGHDDYLRVRLTPGLYAVEYCYLELEYVGCFHRFIRITPCGRTNRWAGKRIISSHLVTLGKGWM